MNLRWHYATPTPESVTSALAMQTAIRGKWRIHPTLILKRTYGFKTWRLVRDFEGVVPANIIGSSIYYLVRKKWEAK